jgi:hypothetical protein
MAKINVSFDTITKEFNVLFNGQTMPNVQYVSIYNDYDNPDKAHIEVSMREESKDDGVVVYTNVSASKRFPDAEVVDIDEYVKPKSEGLVRGAYTLMRKNQPK